MQVSGLGVKNGLGCVNRQSGQSTLIQLDNFAAEFTAENATEREIWKWCRYELVAAKFGKQGTQSTRRRCTSIRV